VIRAGAVEWSQLSHYEGQLRQPEVRAEVRDQLVKSVGVALGEGVSHRVGLALVPEHPLDRASLGGELPHGG